MRAVLFLILPFAANALRLPSRFLPEASALKNGVSEKLESEMEYELACDDNAREMAHKNIAHKNWVGLKQNVCVRGYAEEVQNLEAGVSDAADADEWLMSQPPKLQNATCKKIPELLYIGMGHSGSTSLSAQLNEHPELSYGQVKEHRFTFDKGSTEKNIDLFTRAFKMDCNKKAFDGSIGYIFYSPKQIAEIKNVVGPDAKILMMVREPTKWINSCEKDNAPGIWHAPTGCYADFLERWLEHFPKANFLFEASEDYFKDPRATLARVEKHVGVMAYDYPAKLFESAAGRRRSAPMKAARTDKFQADAKNIDCARRLQRLTNRTFPWAQQMITRAAEVNH